MMIGSANAGPASARTNVAASAKAKRFIDFLPNAAVPAAQNVAHS
jgi:hypothetical protein